MHSSTPHVSRPWSRASSNALRSDSPIDADVIVLCVVVDVAVDVIVSDEIGDFCSGMVL